MSMNELVFVHRADAKLQDAILHYLSGRFRNK